MNTLPIYCKLWSITILSMLLIFSSCRSNQHQNSTEIVPGLNVGHIRFNTKMQDLIERYGEQNIETKTEYSGGEGTVQETLTYIKNENIIIKWDDEKLTHPIMVTVKNEKFQTKEGLKIGISVQKLNEINKIPVAVEGNMLKPFSYNVTSWQGGSLAGYQKPVSLYVELDQNMIVTEIIVYLFNNDPVSLALTNGAYSGKEPLYSSILPYPYKRIKLGSDLTTFKKEYENTGYKDRGIGFYGSSRERYIIDDKIEVSEYYDDVRFCFDSETMKLYAIQLGVKSIDDLSNLVDYLSQNGIQRENSSVSIRDTRFFHKFTCPDNKNFNNYQISIGGTSLNIYYE